jgi:23S rRNA (guanosine2251-2'-O)-methyltransferase
MKKLANTELKRISSEEFLTLKKRPIVIILDNIRSMHNVGAAFRIGDAFLIEKIYLCGITATPPRNEISKTALGAEQHVMWEYYRETIDAIKTLKDEGYTLVGIEQTSVSQDLESFIPDTNSKYALIYGHEVSGVDDEVLALCTHFLEIKQFGVKHSLNVSVSIGIATWHIAKCFNSII